MLHEPLVTTTNRHPCRDDVTKIANWELRIGMYRVYYNVEQQVQIVSVEQIGKPNTHTTKQPAMAEPAADPQGVKSESC